jgi:hypothetical protein
MASRVLPVGLLLLCGCFEHDGPNTLVTPNPFPVTSHPQATAKMTVTPATEAETVRVRKVGDQVVLANAALGLHPAFVTIGAPAEEIFHRGDKEVFVTEGLARQCKTDGQLAAVLSLELGRMVSERERQTPLAARVSDHGPPIAVPVGADAGGRFGAPDGTYQAEQLLYDKARPRPEAPPPPPNPEVLARTYLRKAGFAATEFDDVAPLLRAADAHTTFEKQLTGQSSARGFGW